MDYKKRLTECRNVLENEKKDAVLISNPINRTYISGFSGTNGFALITLNQAKLLTDFRYIEAAGKEAPDFEIIDYGSKLETALNKILVDLGIKTMFFEEEHISYAQYKKLYQTITDVELISYKGLIENLRKIKENEEIEAIQFAAKTSDEALSFILDKTKPGKTEKEIALELEYFIKKQGVEMFPRFIVASGYRSALPHGYASDKVIESGDFLMIDFGAQYQGYYSDITRTFIVGKADQRQRDVYDIVFNAQKTASDTIRPGFSHQQGFQIAESVIQKSGYQLGHGLGHGVGLDIHEEPFINHISEGTLRKNMTFTIEPGIYIPGWGGVRIEDTVVSTSEGCSSLTHFKRELIEV